MLWDALFPRKIGPKWTCERPTAILNHYLQTIRSDRGGSLMRILGDPATYLNSVKPYFMAITPAELHWFFLAFIDLPLISPMKIANFHWFLSRRPPIKQGMRKVSWLNITMVPTNLTDIQPLYAAFRVCANWANVCNYKKNACLLHCLWLLGGRKICSIGPNDQLQFTSFAWLDAAKLSNLQQSLSELTTNKDHQADQSEMQPDA